MKKRILAALLCLCMAVMLLPTSAFANAPFEATIGDNTYTSLTDAVAAAKIGDTIIIKKSSDTAKYDAKLKKGIAIISAIAYYTPNTDPYYVQTYYYAQTDADIRLHNGSVMLIQGSLKCSQYDNPTSEPLYVQVYGDVGAKEYPVTMIADASETLYLTGPTDTEKAYVTLEETAQEIMVNGIVYTTGAAGSKMYIPDPLMSAGSDVTQAVITSINSIRMLGKDGNAVQICTGYSIQDGEKIIITKDTTYGDNIDGTVELCTRDYIYIEYKGTNLDYCYYQSADGSPTVLELGHNETKNTVSLKTGAVKIVKSTILVNGLEIGTFSGDIYENSPRLTISKSADGSATVFVPKNVTIFTIDGISCSTSGGDTELYIDSYGNISLTKGEIDIIHNSPITLGDITYQGIGDARYLITAVDAGVNSIVALTGSVTATFNKNDKKLDIWKYSYHAKDAGCSVIISRVNLDNIVAAGANTVIDGFEISKASDDMFLPSLGNPGCILSFNVNGGSALNPISTVSGAAIDLSVYTTSRDGFTFDGWYSDAALTNRVTSISLIRSTAVYAKWTEVQTSVSAAETEAPADTEAPEAAMLPFSDVAAGDWFCGDVAYVYENALMKGSDETTFSAYSHATRGMIVSVLYRLAGSPDVTGVNPFDDVAAGSYYENAVIWASENGIVNGVGDGKFAPDDDITREQLAAVLYRYAEYAGCDLTASADLTAFTDAGDISGYAAAAISWANANGFISGKGDGILDPLSCAQRCEIAALLHRFCDTFVK